MEKIIGDYVLMRFFKQPFNLLILGVLYFVVMTRPVYAYLDPGTGSFIIQMLVAGIAGALFMLKTYWQKFIGFFTGNRPENEKTPSSEKKSDEVGKPQ
ncbi:MAG: hypothetical protein ACOYXC_01935 [Candidatus Rifleibacteriota bacterium]